jgi:adenosylcobyric acid synthase
LQPEDRARVCGVIINKFRGDPTLFDEGVRFLEERTGVPILGVIPHLPDANIDGEDSLNAPVAFSPSDPRGRIAVLCYPHLANFTDFDALQLEGVDVHFVRHATSLASYSAVILPGSKAVNSDLAWLHRTGVAPELGRYVASGGKVLGVCGGMQMLGRSIEDPSAVESSVAACPALGHLALSTRFEPQKTVRRCRGHVYGAAPTVEVDGYEIHHGVSHHDYPPLFELRATSAGQGSYRDGVRTERVWGTYLHGLFDGPGFRHLFLRWALGDEWQPRNHQHRQQVLDAALDRFATHVEDHVDWSRVLGWVQPNT